MGCMVSRGLMQNAAENQPWEVRSDLLLWKGANTHPEREWTVKSEAIQNSGMTQVYFITPNATHVSLPNHCHHK